MEINDGWQVGESKLGTGHFFRTMGNERRMAEI